uniref:Uncharacterized protein n=1 Tax=Setaria viridis TaxID=4556 RepID=A0A4U6VKK5_SETVI|nr:hypothetical protein SEVIR_3G387950v2 [Setaria viridis]
MGPAGCTCALLREAPMVNHQQAPPLLYMARSLMESLGVAPSSRIRPQEGERRAPPSSSACMRMENARTAPSSSAGMRVGGRLHRSRTGSVEEARG